MTSELYVWCWLPGAHEAVVAGKLSRDPATGIHRFVYGRSYLARDGAVSRAQGWDVVGWSPG